MCNSKENARIGCTTNEIIIVKSAKYGRMELGRCITEPNEFMGCTNDVLPLIDKWCSGRRECELGVPNPDLEQLSVNCLKVLIKYLLVQYSCVTGKRYIVFNVNFFPKLLHRFVFTFYQNTSNY